MKVSRCITRNFGGGTGRICLKLEPEFWTMLGEICDREGVEMTTLLRGMDGGCHPDNRASAVRVYVATYFHAVAAGTDHARFNRNYIQQKRSPERLTVVADHSADVLKVA